MKQVKLTGKLRDKSAINAANRKHGKPWVDSQGLPLDPDHICAVWDKYRAGKIDATQLRAHFGGRTIQAISTKVWKLRGRGPVIQKTDPNQEDLFRQALPEEASHERN